MNLEDQPSIVMPISGEDKEKESRVVWAEDLVKESQAMREVGSANKAETLGNRSKFDFQRAWILAEGMTEALNDPYFGEKEEISEELIRLYQTVHVEMEAVNSGRKEAMPAEYQNLETAMQYCEDDALREWAQEKYDSISPEKQ